MTFDEWWAKEVCCTGGECSYCKTDFSCTETEKLCRKAWEAALPKWTYCKDAMPKKGGEYWCTCKNLESDKKFFTKIMYFHKSDYIKNSHNFNFCNDEGYTCTVLAWMPLPEAMHE